MHTNQQSPFLASFGLLSHFKSCLSSLLHSAYSLFLQKSQHIPLLAVLTVSAPLNQSKTAITIDRANGSGRRPPNS